MERVFLLSEENPMVQRIPKVWDDFRVFIKRGSFFDMATAMVVGGAFGKVINSFVNDLFTPLVSLLLTAKLSEVFFVIKSGPNFPYNTREQAIEDGAVTLNYGNFIETGINFMILSMCFYVVFKSYTKIHRELEDEITPPSASEATQINDGHVTQ